MTSESFDNRKPFTVYLNESEVEDILRLAQEWALPKHVLARSILVQGIRKEIAEFNERKRLKD